MKFADKYLEPYEITRVMRNQRYSVHKIGESEDPTQTTTSADFMDPWIRESSNDSSEDETISIDDVQGRMCLQDGRV